MAKTLLIGSTVCDVMIYLDRLPGREGDAHIDHQSWAVGGCAFNASTILHQMGATYQLISPVGQGVYGQFVKNELKKLGMNSSISLEGDNGCCYCFIEADGERTFLSDHGVEYSFQKEWLDPLRDQEFDAIYLCGLEVEEPTGLELIQAVSSLNGQVVFAPGPRGLLIPQDRMDAVFDLHPILHLNEAEAIAYSKKDSIEEAAPALFERTKRLVIITLGEKGACAYDGEWYHARAYPTTVKDTVGAGDCHLGAFLTARQFGKDIENSLDFANRVSSQVVATSGVHLDAEGYGQLRKWFTESAR